MAHEKENKFDLISIAKSGDEKTGHKKGKGAWETKRTFKRERGADDEKTGGLYMAIKRQNQTLACERFFSMLL